ncbi:AMP-binding protein [Kitasatospora sp. MMS16-BH015]|uniref:non-ribosomal peptide synthetase n=1 Tax=Kitasatospora sp. MMS16-BH015 TaxID=2018025 RepID=UPI00131A58CF|nr:AMP-binding protein [Kitasatospora sp. MMS16-BH015]
MGERVARELHFGSLLDLLPADPGACAVAAPSARGRSPLSYPRLHEFLGGAGPFDDLGLTPGDRCAIAIPEGPELAVCLLAVGTRCAAVPMNPWNPEGEVATDLAETAAKALIVPVGTDFDHLRRAARTAGVEVVDLCPDPSAAGLFTLAVDGRAAAAAGLPAARQAGRRINGPEDIALELFTSGTSGRKKRVPIRLRDLVVGASCIAAALELGPEDRGFNMMPLFHAGGIVRNLFAPLLAGSSMVYSDGFDPAAFWDELVGGGGFTWYYASPTMHDGILHEGRARTATARLRFVCNAAGDLLPSTAARLRERFQAAVLPGYGMTECMPIAIPPLDYRLERQGASGLVLGPRVRILDERGHQAPTGVDGRIMISGVPLARIVQDEPGPGEPPVPAGWFDTGDLGRFDEDGYLYVVARAKDVIKRGGETIAPAEIEDVVVAHPDVRAALAFAVPHPVLGEVAGCVVVPHADRRVDLDGLAPVLSAKLAPAKWPMLLVYMDDLPKGPTGKVLRLRLAGRLGIDQVDERTPARRRLHEAICPPVGAPLTDSIPAEPVVIEPDELVAAIRSSWPAATDVYVSCDPGSGVLRAAVETAGAVGCPGTAVPDGDALREALRSVVHDYLLPRAVTVLEAFPRLADGEPDREQLQALTASDHRPEAGAGDEIEAHLLAQWRTHLGADREIDLDSDFFDDLGGASLTAVQIIAELRTHYGIALPPTAVFRHRSVRALAALVRAGVADLGADTEDAGRPAAPLPGGPAPRPQTAVAALLTQLVPLALLPAALQLGQFAAWITFWWYLRGDLGLSGLWVMFAALGAAVATRKVVAPIAAIGLKWALVGRYCRGVAPLWGQAYLRWWLAHQVQTTVGLGVFGLSYPLTALYYRLMGARVGRRTRIAATADLGEFDLLTIGDDAVVDEGAIVRPFGFEGGAMSLRPIRLGAGCSIGTRSTVVPGADLPAGTELAPLGTSTNPRSLDQGTRVLSRALVYSPPSWLKGLGTLIKGAVTAGAWMPMILLIHALMSTMVTRGIHLHGPADLLVQMMSLQRLLRAVTVLAVSTVTAPFLYLAGVILVKWTVIGRFRADDDITKAWPKFERWLVWRLLPDGGLGGAGRILGANFAAISVVLRLLGAKVGKRIYWPGSGHVMTEYDLFECGDDVTFGSRSTYLMTDAHGSRPIRIEAGANVADRCVLAPGVIVERNAVLGSGTYAPTGFTAPAGSTWIGQDGRLQPIELEPATPRRAEADTLRPYAQAMYHRQAPYRVWPLAAHIGFNLANAVWAALYRAAPLSGALLITWELLRVSHGSPHSTAALLALTLLLYIPLHLVGALGATAVVVATKRRIIGGLRTSGEHFWTQDSYCQRWKIHTVISSLTGNWFGGRNLLDFLGGSAYLVWFFRYLGARIGRGVCLYPNGADPMMEEADLTTIGDGACIDQAVLIAHLNTRGEWTMGTIEIGAGACLRAQSRVMMMGSVAEGATLLEGTLLLAGDAALPFSVWDGWPGQAIAGGALEHRVGTAGTGVSTGTGTGTGTGTVDAEIASEHHFA